MLILSKKNVTIYVYFLERRLFLVNKSIICALIISSIFIGLTACGSNISDDDYAQLNTETLNTDTNNSDTSNSDESQTLPSINIDTVQSLSNSNPHDTTATQQPQTDANGNTVSYSSGNSENGQVTTTVKSTAGVSKNTNTPIVSKVTTKATTTTPKVTEATTKRVVTGKSTLKVTTTHQTTTTPTTTTTHVTTTTTHITTTTPTYQITTTPNASLTNATSMTTDTTTTEAPANNPNMNFSYNGSSFTVGNNMQDILAILGDPIVYSSDNNMYVYAQFIIYAHTDDGVNYYAYDIEITDENVYTNEGIHIGSTADEVISAYGTGSNYSAIGDYINYYSTPTTYFYFKMENGVVSKMGYYMALNY